ncbi:MAG: VCBS repeat-containing protein [Myxococcales bacterium]|nr:VCBS repeat-containing protein [Myxococcales bacterium]MCB9532289.1 VCBS repeat-containing protein [Myxococcales bacterium]
MTVLHLQETARPTVAALACLLAACAIDGVDADPPEVASADAGPGPVPDSGVWVGDDADLDSPAELSTADAVDGPLLAPCTGPRSETIPGLGATGAGVGGGVASKSPAFDDVTDLVGLPELYGRAASWGDIDGDGMPDLFVGSAGTSPMLDAPDAAGTVNEVFVNCGGWFEPLSLPRRTSGDPVDLHGAAATGIADMDGDGRVDLLLSSTEDIFVYYQREALKFSVVRLHLHDRRGGFGMPGINSFNVYDFDGDGALDIFVSNLGQPEMLLMNEGDGVFVDRAPLSVSDATVGGRTSLDSETFGSLVFPDPDDERDPYLFIGDDGGLGSSLLCWDPGDMEFVTMAANLEGKTTMYLDVAYLDDDQGALVASTQTAAWQLHRVQAGTIVSMSESIQPRETLTQWGVNFADFDLDGLEDLLMVAGVADMDPELRATWGSTGESHLVLFHAVDSGTPVPQFVDESPSAGPLFDHTLDADREGSAIADFDGDGCMDVVVTPLRTTRNRPVEFRYYDRIRVLRNRCDYGRDFVGVRLSPVIGTLVSATVVREDGGIVVRTRLIKGGGSVGASDTSTIPFGLADGERVAEIRVRCPDGEDETVDGAELVAGSYTDRRELCVR